MSFFLPSAVTTTCDSTMCPCWRRSCSTVVCPRTFILMSWLSLVKTRSVTFHQWPRNWNFVKTFFVWLVQSKGYIYTHKDEIMMSLFFMAVSNSWQLKYLFNSLFRLTTKNKEIIHITNPFKFKFKFKMFFIASITRKHKITKSKCTQGWSNEHLSEWFPMILCTKKSFSWFNHPSPDHDYMHQPQNHTYHTSTKTD